MKKFGILGSMFDPPHNGHLAIAQAAYEKFVLDKILFIPAYKPPHRDVPVTGSKQRLEMTQLAIRSLPFAEVSNIEVVRGDISYTVDTLRTLTKKHPKTMFYLILGTDAMELFPTWKDPTSILNDATVIVASRPGYDNTKILRSLSSEPFAKFKNKVQFLECNSPDISSSELRTMVKAKQDIGEYVPSLVSDFVAKNGLYI